jgi:hypothetical protein
MRWQAATSSFTKCRTAFQTDTSEVMCISLQLWERYTFILARWKSVLSLKKSILVLLRKPFSPLSIVTVLRLGSARSSSSSCFAAPLAWAEEPTTLIENFEISFRQTNKVSRNVHRVGFYAILYVLGARYYIPNHPRVCWSNDIHRT